MPDFEEAKKDIPSNFLSKRSTRQVSTTPSGNAQVVPQTNENQFMPMEESGNNLFEMLGSSPNENLGGE